MLLDNIVFKAGRNKPFPKGHLSGLPNGRFKIYFEEPGNYLIRITDFDGKVIAPVVIKQITKASSEMLNPASFNLAPGMYYIQLFKEKELIHFLEYQLAMQNH